MDICRQVGLNVRRYRLALGLSQEGLAHECGLHRTYISGVERGIRNPTVRVLATIATALGIAVHRLLEVDDESIQENKPRNQQPNT